MSQTEDEAAPGTLTRAGLTEVIHRDIGLSRSECTELVNKVFDVMSDALVAGDPIKISSFGTFSLRDKSERVGRNPKTGELFPITPRRVLVFRASQILKNSVNTTKSK